MKTVRTVAFAAAFAFAGVAFANLPVPKPPEAQDTSARPVNTIGQLQPAPGEAAPATEAAAVPAEAPAPPAEAAPAPPAPQHPQGIEKAGPSGVIEGGWGYVYASYAVALLGLALYALSLWTRRPGAQPPSGDVP